MATRGRPSKYTKAVAERLCAELAKGKSLRRICREDDSLPAEVTVRQWAAEDRNGFYAHYTRARDIGLDAMADQVVDIADGAEADQDTDIARDRLRFDARRWYLSKMAPKRYGDKVALTGEDGGPVKHQFVAPDQYDEDAWESQHKS